MLDQHAQAHLAQGKHQIIERFWDARNIVSVGMSTRETRGERTDEPAVRVGVMKKRRPGYLRASDILPDRIDIDGVSYKVDVVETGEIFGKVDRDFRPPEWTYDSTSRPLQPGVMIVNSSNKTEGGYYGGTLGCFVRDSHNQICILSNRHVLVNLVNRDPNNNEITQPKPSGSTSNAVAMLATDTPWKQGIHAENHYDATYARLLDQSNATYSQTPVHSRMAAPAPDHKAVGLFFAGNSHNSYGYISKMHYILDSLSLSMLTPGSACAPGDYRFLANIRKAGARSGYSSTRIEDLSATVKVSMHDGKKYNFTDVLGTGRMGWPGDSGSLVCYGGTGFDWVPLKNPDAGECSIWASVGKMYNLPLQGDIPVADRLRDEFLSQTTLGNFLVELFYLNAEAIVSRTESAQTSPYEKAAARALYDKYRNLMESALNNPADPRFTVRQEHLDDTNQVINGISAHLRAEEAQALRTIYEQSIKPTLGMGHRDLITHMNDRKMFDFVRDQLARVPTITTRGVVTGK